MPEVTLRALTVYHSAVAKIVCVGGSVEQFGVVVSSRMHCGDRNECLVLQLHVTKATGILFSMKVSRSSDEELRILMDRF